MFEGAIVHNPADPDPWLALQLDGSLPIDSEAKALLIASQRSRSRQFLLPFVRPLARLAIVAVQLWRTAAPARFTSSRILHRLMAWGMAKFVRPEANLLILRHFHLGAEILGFIADNLTPGFRPQLEAMRPRCIADVRDDLFLKHDLNIYNFIIALNAEMERRGVTVGRRDMLDFSAIADAPPQIEVPVQGRLNVVDLETAIEFYTPLYGLLLSDRDFWRAANSLQLDETVALYAARLLGSEQHLALVNNGHPLVPLPTWGAGHRLMLHGLATETLHGFLRAEKARRASGRRS
jgi:Family of unknown function (DUF6999)